MIDLTKKLKQQERSLAKARELLDIAFDDFGNDRRNKRTLRVRELEGEVAGTRRHMELMERYGSAA